MPLSFPCSHCERQIRVRDEFAGQKARCPACRKVIEIPPAGACVVKAVAKKQTAGSSNAARKKAKRSANRTPAKPLGPTEDSSTAAAAAAEPDPADDVFDDGFLAGLSSEGEAVHERRSQKKKKAKRKSRRPDQSSDAAAYMTEAPEEIIAARKKNLRKSVMDGFSGPIDRVKTTLLYRIGVVLAASFVVLLPVLYVALIGFAGYGVYWHATENVEIASAGRGRGRIFAVLLYAAPIVAGGISVLFMLKPLFARSVRPTGEISLNRAAQPLLYEFVDRICDTVHAPRPARIDVTFDINASAHVANGFFGLFQRELVLTIGLPLVAGMPLQNLAGILAHEFGHFSQGAGMRVTMIIRNVNFWFAKVVYMRDEWDEWLVSAAHETDIRIGWVFHIARLAVFLSRGILWCFMMISHAATCWLARQMEFDADRYEYRLAGSAAFEETTFRLQWLGYGMQDYFRNTMHRAPGEQTGNPIRDFVRHCESLTEKDRKRVRRRMEKSTTGFFDVHPADSERIAMAQKENAPGVFTSQLPADAIFKNFDTMCAQMMML